MDAKTIVTDHDMAEVRFLAPSIFCACKLPVISWVFFVCVGVSN